MMMKVTSLTSVNPTVHFKATFLDRQNVQTEYSNAPVRKHEPKIVLIFLIYIFFLIFDATKNMAKINYFGFDYKSLFNF
jgi:hypothetical protein